MHFFSFVHRPDGPIHLWDSDGVILWLSYLGLGMYSNEVKRWVKSGQQLLEATNKELEKELGVKVRRLFFLKKI